MTENDKNQPTSTGESADKAVPPDSKDTPNTPHEGDDVIDAEVVSEARLDEGPLSASAYEPTRKKESIISQIGFGWLLAALLLVFIAGLIAAPLARESLADLGVLDDAATTTPSAGPIALPLDALNPSGLEQINGDIITLRGRIDRQAQEIATLKAGQSARERARPATDIALPQSPELTSRIDRLQRDVESLTRTLGNISSDSGGGASGAEVVTLRNSLSTLQREVETLTNRLATTEATTRGLEAGAIAATPRGRLFLRLNALEDQINSNEAFGSYLDDLRPDIAVLPPIDQSRLADPIAVLRQYQGGVRSRQTIKSIFYQILPDLQAATDRAEGSLLAGLLSVRRVDDKATGMDGVITRAEAAIERDDIATAYATLNSSLEGDARTVATTWLSRTAAYLEVSDAIELIRRLLLDNVAFQEARRD